MILAAVALSVVLALFTGTPQRVTVARTTADVDRDGQLDTVSVVMTNGRRSDDSASPWCGGGARYEGAFSVVVRSKNRIAETPLDSLLGRSPLSFPARPWTLVLADYNQDGQMEFNLGQYGSCNGWIYRMLTLRPSGRVERVSEEFRVSDFVPSTPRVSAIEHGFQVRYYDNADAHAGHWLVRYRWNPAIRAFEKVAETRVE